MPWSAPELLKTFPSPAKLKITISHNCPEVTFEGVKSQPDFGTLLVKFSPRTVVLELKSLKMYLQTFRKVVISYERFVTIVFDDLLKCLNPTDLYVRLQTKPRGGISSTIEIGREKY